MGLPPPYKILVLSRNYPNSVTPILGLWVEGLVNHLSKLCDIRVIAPVPYCPPLPPGMNEFTRFRQIERERLNGVKVFHPRFLVGPGYSLYNLEADSYYWGIRRHVDRLRREFPFDLIHANFGYPDGVVAAKLARRYNVPFLITEHASWIPWMEDYPQARRKAVWAASQCAFHIAVSSYARSTIAHYTGDTDKLRVLPNGVDVSVFKPLQNRSKPKPNQILFVGLMRRVKGIDILLNAMRRLVDRQPDLKLVFVGGGVYRDYIEQEKEFRRMAHELGIEKNIEFAGIKSPEEVANYMRESTLLVLPSRAETFGVVLIEALACGIPVVATKCGGPEDIVNEKVGRLVPKEDANALTEAIAEVIAERDKYDAQQLREYVLQNFSWENIARRMIDLYGEAVNARCGGNNEIH